MNGQRRASRIQRAAVAMLACAVVQVAMASSALQLLQPGQLEAWTVHMIALNGIGDSTGRWVEHERDVAADFKRYFGEAPVGIDAVALMTDTDQSGTSATAWYADVRFEGK